MKDGLLLTMDYYGRQTCLNGHIVSNYVGSGFENTHQFCSLCGAETLINCPTCATPQQGSGVDTVSIQKSPDAYCRNCGKPYPWTKAHLEATIEMVNEEESLSPENKTILAGSLPDLIAENPRTALAATRFKRIVATAGKGFKEAMYKFIVDVSSESVKKIVSGQ